VTQEYADAVGADGYSADAAGATKRAKELLEARRALAAA
jgi:5-methyltetrahydrofolate--homocysteine methyltransferase